MNSEEEPAETASDRSETEPSSTAAEYLVALNRLEQALIQLLRIAADSLEVLGSTLNGNGNEAPLDFSNLSGAYFQLLDKVQFGIRSAIHQLHQEQLLLWKEGGGHVLAAHYRPVPDWVQREQRVHLLRNLLRLATEDASRCPSR